jgi:Cof subfamily protein (haloacid dehalogenase superfamily)
MTHSIRLVAIDLDGTLFDSHQEVTSASRAALQRLVKAGIQPFLVTGRGQLGVEMALEMIGMDLPYAASAGALICSGKGGEIISARTFHAKLEVDRVIDFARRHNAGLIADTLDGNIWFGPDELLDRIDPLSAAAARQSRRTFIPEDDFDRPILKLSIAGSLELLAQAETDVLADCPSFYFIYAGLNYMDVTACGVDKRSALELFAARMGVLPSEIAAIGDQPIDLSMLQFASLSIAMGNAPESVKQAAGWIAPTNDEDGVAWALERLAAIHRG